MIEVARALLLGVVAAGVLSALSTSAAAELYSCRGYPSRTILAEIKLQVETLRRTEREAADRLVGLDTRPYDWLLDQARTAESETAVPALLAAEDALSRCRNFILPLRRGCAVAAAALVRVIEGIVAGEASGEAKKAYAQTMPHCERAVSVTPLDTTLRKFE